MSDGLAPGQVGRLFENLVESLYTTGSNGRLFTYLPLVDAWGVDRVVSVDGGSPVFIQIKAQQHRNAQGNLTFQTDEAQSPADPRWILVLVHGTPAEITDIFVLNGLEWRERASHTVSSRGVPLLEAGIPLHTNIWDRYRVEPPALGSRLLEIARPGLGVTRDLTDARHTTVDGTFFEAELTAAIVGATDQLAIYRPAVDFDGRDFLVQKAGGASYAYVQVKGVRYEHSPGRIEIGVGKNTFALDRKLIFLFAYAPPGGPWGPVWVTDAIELAERAHQSDAASLNFSASITTADPVWADRRMRPDEVANELLRRITG